MNALEGLSQETLDGGWSGKGISAYAKRLEETNAELLAALECLYEVATIDNDKDYAAVTNAAAVIAKARGAQ
ncbi:hypothetical protein AZ20_4225 [Bordetella bronchiseptica E014]|nr:hypothetical protein AZ20_4225 [Bordetella bronchiseptica E014]